MPDKMKAKSTKMVGVADTGASVLCARKNIMRQMGVEEMQLCLTTTVIRVANQIKLNVLGMVPVTRDRAGCGSSRETNNLSSVYRTGAPRRVH